MQRTRHPTPIATDARRQGAPSAAPTQGARVVTAVRCFDASPRATAQALQLHALFGTGIVQRKSEVAVRKELADGLLMANLQGNFITNHGQGVANNVEAAKVHARRKNVPQTNTVIKDLRVLKQGLATEPFAPQGVDSWRVTTAAPIDLVDTTKKNGAIAPEAAAAVPVATDLGGDAFQYDGNEVASVTGLALTAGDLLHANQQAGAKPKSSAKPQVKNDYRLRFLQAVNTYRRAQAAAGDQAWVKANFTHVTGKALAGVEAADINAIAAKQERVTVFINKQSGDIWHFDGYD